MRSTQRRTMPSPQYLQSLCVLVALGVSPLSATAQDGPVDDPSVDSVRATIVSLAAHYEAGELDEAGRIFAEGPSVHIIEGTGVNHGWTDYRDNHLAPEIQSFENFRYRYFAVEPVVVQDMSYVAFRYELAADTPSGHVETEGRGTAVLRRMSDGWKIVHLHTSGRRR